MYNIYNKIDKKKRQNIKKENGEKNEKYRNKVLENKMNELQKLVYKLNSEVIIFSSSLLSG